MPSSVGPAEDTVDQPVCKPGLVCMCVTQVAAREHLQLANHLRQLTNLKRVSTLTLLTSDVWDAPPSADATLLRASLDVARALPCEPGRMVVVGWYATEAVVAELRGLPSWRRMEIALTTVTRQLNASDIYWPLTRASMFIPRCVMCVCVCVCVRVWRGLPCTYQGVCRGTHAHTHTHTHTHTSHPW